MKQRESKEAELELKSITKSKKKLVPVKRNKYSKKSRELHDVIEENHESLRKEIERLKSLADIDKESSSEEELVELESQSRLDSDRSLVWDNQGDLASPLKDTGDLLDTSFRFEEDQDSLPPALSRERSVSVSINRASYLTLESGEILDIQPVCRNLNKRFDYLRPSSEPRSLASQDSFLERNLKAKEVETLNLISEEVEELNENNFEEENLAADKMEENVYKEHLKRLKSEQRKVKRKIDGYTASDVTITDKDEFRTYLKDARNEYETFEDAADAVIDQLDAEVDALRIDEVEALVRELSSTIKKNEKEVKEKIAEVMAQAAINAPQSEADKR